MPAMGERTIPVVNRRHMHPSTSAALTSLPPWVRLIEGDGTGQGAPPAPTPAVPPVGQPPVGTPTQGQPQGTQNGPNGYPESTPLAEMTADQREAYWKAMARKHETASKTKDVELAALKPKAEQHDAAIEASRSEAEKAVAAAEQRGKETGVAAAEAAAVAKYGAALVTAKFETALAGRLTAEQVATLVGGLNVAVFLGPDGLPDAQKITDYAAAIPAPAAQGALPPASRDLGGGRTAPPPTTGTAAGKALYESRHPRRTT